MVRDKKNRRINLSPAQISALPYTAEGSYPETFDRWKEEDVFLKIQNLPFQMFTLAKKKKFLQL